MRKSLFILLVINILFINTLFGEGLDTLAVLPFKLIGDFKNPEIYGYGIPDAIANDLAQIPGLTLVDRLKLSSILNELKLSQAGFISEESAPKVGEIIGAEGIIVGTVQKIENTIRIHARLINVNTAQIVFSIEENRKFNSLIDIFKLEDLVTQKILSYFDITPKEEIIDKIEEIPTASEDAFYQYSKGIKLFDTGNVNGGMRAFKKAKEIDQQFHWIHIVRTRAKDVFKELDKEVNKINK